MSKRIIPHAAKEVNDGIIRRIPRTISARPLITFSAFGFGKTVG